MHWLTLPEPAPRTPPAFHDRLAAKLWLAEQLEAAPRQSLAAICRQIEAIDASPLTPKQAIELLAILRSAAIPLLAGIEPGFIRKPLPLPGEDKQAFEVSQQFWLSLGIAYLRRAPHFVPAEKIVLLHRAANAFRLAQYAHFQASHACPELLDRLLFSVLVQAERHALLRQPISDPDFPQLGEFNIAGSLSWAYLLHQIDPYRLTAGQLAVANRAIRRWRELTGFQSSPASSPKAQLLDLSGLLGAVPSEGMPRWLDVRPVSRKLRQRIDALIGGETPEALKLGSDLSSQACIALLEAMDLSLHAHPAEISEASGEIELVFGCDHAYALLRGELPNPPVSAVAQHTPLSYQRMAMFGSERDGAGLVKSIERGIQIPRETWLVRDGQAIRKNNENSPRHITNCLVASSLDGEVRLGVLQSLQTGPADTLSARLKWFEARIEVGKLKRSPQQAPRQPSIPVFVLHADEGLSVLVPINAGTRLGSGMVLESASPEHLLPSSVIERGIDFIRYACQPS